MEESIYGKDAVTGNVDDVLKDRDVVIKTTETQTISTKEVSEEKPPEEKAPEDKPPVSGDLEKNIQTQIEANKDLGADLGAKGIDFAALTTEYEKDGTFSAETFAALEKAGYPKSAVDAYIQGMEATAVMFENAVHEMAGGKQEYQQLAAYIQSQGNEKIDAFNKVLETGNFSQIEMVMSGIKSQMTASYGTKGQTLLGTAASTAETKGFSDKAEMINAMSDSRYGRDPAYTREVEQKTIASNFLK